MAMTTRKNATVKALQAKMATEKKHNANALLEWEISCNTNSARGATYDQSDIINAYDRYGDACGASKATHIHNHHGDKFEYIVIKRHRRHGWMPNANDEHGKCTGNQLIDEINCWLEFAETETSDLLCPILKYFTSKSDKVTAQSKTMQNNVIIIAQKAQNIGTAREACKDAEKLNSIHGYKGETAVERYGKLEKLSKKQGWRDAMHNGGNSGVIFDYSKNCYKAVFIDYAL